MSDWRRDWEESRGLGEEEDAIKKICVLYASKSKREKWGERN